MNEGKYMILIYGSLLEGAIRVSIHLLGNNKSVHTFVFRYMECMNALIKSKRGTARYAVFS